MRDRKKNSVTITGRKLSTLPTPVKMPSMTRLWMTGFTPMPVRALSVRADSLSIPIASKVWSHLPMTLNVR